MMNETETATLRVALVGTGRMGGEIERLAPAHNIDVAARFDSTLPLTATSPGDFDVAIDFTRPDALLHNIETMVAWRKPLVIGTTGWLESLDRVKELVQEHGGKLIYASNFSVGVNIFFRIVRDASRLFNSQPSYDVALHEIHHTGKADAPSGTALSIANIILGEIGRKSGILATPPAGKISPALLHVTSQRLGATVGTHSVSFDSPADTIELVHRAKDRSGFALGALMAARWIVEQRPGIYKFEDLF